MRGCGCVYVCHVLLLLYLWDKFVNTMFVYYKISLNEVKFTSRIVITFSLNLNFIIKDNIFTYLNISVITDTKLIY